MLEVTERLDGPAATAATLTLPFEQRQKSRLRTRLDDGTEIALLLPTRGTILRDGDSLRAENGLVIQVRAASEAVSLACTADPWQLARASYHLGNRHVPLQIGEGWLRYLHDHVLDEMVRTLGLQVEFEQAPFEPEGGAYASHGAITHPGGHRHAHG